MEEHKSATRRQKEIEGLDIAVDPGTSITRVYLKGEGVVLQEPSLVTLDTKSNTFLAVGEEAEKLAGGTPPHVVTVLPLKNGLIGDFDTTEEMLRYFIHKTRKRPRPGVLVAVPSSISEVERNAFEEATLIAGADKVVTIDQTLAAAIGAGLDLQNPETFLAVDIGASTAQAAVISEGEIAFCRTAPACERETAIPELVAELVKGALGAMSGKPGRDMESLGIVLTGGGALVPGLARTIEDETGLSATVAEKPRLCVIEGCGRCLEGSL